VRRKIPVVLSQEEVKKIIEQPNKRVPTGLRNKALLSFLWDSGARVSDVINLKPGNIRIGKREVVFLNGKGGVDRTAGFSDYTAELLEKYKAIRPAAKTFFCTLEGKPLNRFYLYSMIRRYAKRVGIDKKVGVHTIRHSFALDYYQRSGHDLIGLQKILGHENIRTTEIYCYINPEEVMNGLKNYYEKREGAEKTAEQTAIEKIAALSKELGSLKASLKK
jgi:integrase/recombinase XerD